MITSIGSVSFRGNETQKFGVVDKIKNTNRALKDTFNADAKKKSNANIFLSGATILGILTMLIGAKKALPKYLGAALATAASVTSINLNWFSGEKKAEEPLKIELESQEAKPEQVQAPADAAQTSAASVQLPVQG